MASAILIPIGVGGLTLTANLYPAASDTAVEAGMALVEKTNAKGWYACENTGTETGPHRLQILRGTDTAGVYWVTLTNTSPTEDIAADAPAVGDWNSTQRTAILAAVGDITDIKTLLTATTAEFQVFGVVPDDITAPVPIKRGNTYKEQVGTGLRWILTTSLAFTRATLKIYPDGTENGTPSEYDCTLTATGTGYLVKAELTDQDTSALSVKNHRYEIDYYTALDDVLSLTVGVMAVTK